MKIFVSYTTRDGTVTVERLKVIYKSLRVLGSVYIDLLHNDSKQKQLRVEHELVTSDILVLLKTPYVRYSPWVVWELTIAKQYGIPIYSTEFQDIIILPF